MKYGNESLEEKLINDYGRLRDKGQKPEALVITKGDWSELKSSRPVDSFRGFEMSPVKNRFLGLNCFFGTTTRWISTENELAELKGIPIPASGEVE